MKIAIPWPAKVSSQPRVKEALTLWEDRTVLLLCAVGDTMDPFLSRFHTAPMPRNSTTIGTQVPKCFIYDMLKAVREMFPDEDWYGFGNSDCVLSENPTQGYEDYQALIYHRIEIPDWTNRSLRFEKKGIPKELASEIWQMKQDGMNERKIARTLNRSVIPAPPGHAEWTSANIRQLFVDQGFVFFWGQDMFLFRADVVDQILEGYLKEKDFVLGTGGFDPILSRYLLENFKAARVIDKLYHKIHHSEWKNTDPDYIHNGGDVEISERWEHRETEFITKLCANGQKASIPKFIKYLVWKENPELAEQLKLTE